MLQAIRSAGARVAVVTSKNRATSARGLAVAGLDDLVEAVVACDDVTHPKPHPEPVARALSLLGARPHRTVFVGDSLHDLHSGRAAGVRTAAALWGPFSRADLAEGAPDFWVEDPRDLVTVLGVEAVQI
jgi:pyrophosphatase PpaX